MKDYHLELIKNKKNTKINIVKRGIKIKKKKYKNGKKQKMFVIFVNMNIQIHINHIICNRKNI
jgi:hypothetical protein